jgi:hypothetical protein
VNAFLAVVISVVLVDAVLAALHFLGIDVEQGPATLLLDATLILATIAFARRRRGARLSDLGIRPAASRASVGWVVERRRSTVGASESAFPRCKTAPSFAAAGLGGENQRVRHRYGERARQSRASDHHPQLPVPPFPARPWLCCARQRVAAHMTVTFQASSEAVDAERRVSGRFDFRGVGA